MDKEKIKEMNNIFMDKLVKSNIILPKYGSPLKLWQRERNKLNKEDL